MPRPRLPTLKSYPGPAGAVGSFVLPLRKLVLTYCPLTPSSEGMRQWISRNVVEFARARPSVEVIVREAPNKQPLARGMYLNGREKVISLRRLPATGVAPKIDLLATSSGRKIASLKRKTVVSTTESARGIWSTLHADRRIL